MRPNRFFYLLIVPILSLTCCLLAGQTAKADKAVPPMLSLLLAGNGATMKEKIPSLTLMVAKDIDKIELAWIPGSDGKTPTDQVKYDIYLGTQEDFSPTPDHLQTTVTGVSQAEITGLNTDTLYYALVVARYATSSSDPSNRLQTKTYAAPTQVDKNVTLSDASTLGLGKHTTTDGIVYTYSSADGELPDEGSVLVSEDVAGGTTLRTVKSVSRSGDIVTVETMDASLTDPLDSGTIYSSFQLFDIAAEAKNLPESNKKIATAKTTTSEGVGTTRIEWKNKLLLAEQKDYTYAGDDLFVVKKGTSTIINLFEPKAAESSFIATVTADFEPELITSAEWGGRVVKQLHDAKVSARGILSLTALAEYNFSAAGEVKKEFTLFERTWYATYMAGPVPVYQEITLSMDVAASASASAEIKALAKANLTETVEVGARYNGVQWNAFIIHDEKSSLTASLDIVGKAKAEIRIIPKIEVEFYKVACGNLSVEPFAASELAFEETTNNTDFLATHSDRLIQLTAFNASLGIESNVAVTLGALGKNWEILPSTCVLGTGNCLTSFNPITLFSLPVPQLSITDFTSTKTDLKFKITDGVYNDLAQSSIEWEAFPADNSTITPGSCTKEKEVTTCTATFKPATEKEYTVFASAFGESLGEISRRYEEVDIGGGCPTGDQTVIVNGHEWQRCDNGRTYNFEDAITYCEDLELDGHSDWRLPGLSELYDLVVCSNGCPVPGQAEYCGDESGGEECKDSYDIPTISGEFQCHTSAYATTSEVSGGLRRTIWFGDGGISVESIYSRTYVRCIRN